MEYAKRSVNGNAGEYLVAYKISKLFGWPCRLYGIDLGVDGEVEIVDCDQHSGGDIIKLQIKALDLAKIPRKFSIYVDDAHINYWKRFCVPVIICAVDLWRENIYWRQITTTEAYETDGKSRKVEFSVAEDLLTDHSREKWRELVAPPESKNIAEGFAQLEELKAALPASTTTAMDEETINAWEDLCDRIDDAMAKIDALIVHYPWRVSHMDVGRLDRLRNRVRILRNNCSYTRSVMTNGM